MASNELNHDDWVEIRARVDSIANGIYLIAGGALTLSITSLLNLKAKGYVFPQETICQITYSWYLLLGSIIAFILLKIHLVRQSYQRNTIDPTKYNKALPLSNKFGWALGVSGITMLIIGMALIINVATTILSA